MSTNKSKKTKTRTQSKDLPKNAKSLTKAEAKNVKGGLLPYVEQDNIYRSPSISDGTSNIKTK
jgi:hypothetical protein